MSHNLDGQRLRFDPQHLLKLARDKSEKGRNRLTSEVSDVFQHRLTEQEQRLASEIMITLLLQAELNLREELSTKICNLENVPLELVLTFAHDEIMVARHMLMHSPVLSDVDMLYIIEEKGQEHWQALSKRPRVSPVVVNRLIDTDDAIAATNLVKNDALRFSRTTMKKLCNMALEVSDLHEPLMERNELDNELAMGLYLTVSQDLRKEIMDTHHFSSLELDRAFSNMVLELSKEGQGIDDVSIGMLALATRFNERGEITPDLLIKTLRRGQLAFFIALFSAWLDINPSIIKLFIRKEGGIHLAAACRAAGIIKSEFASIYLLSRGVYSGKKITGKDELSKAIDTFDSTEELDINKLLKIWADKNEKKQATDKSPDNVVGKAEEYLVESNS